MSTSDAPAFPTPVWPSMESLEETNPLRQYYPETFYPNGMYFQSPYGRVRFWTIGPKTGKKIVFIHGISAPSIVFASVAPALADKGFRILLYDTHGRGYSEAPKIPHEANVYVFQLAFLLQYLGWDKVNLVGFSMGGAVAAAFAASFPHLLDETIVLLASAGMMEASHVVKAHISTPVEADANHTADASTPSPSQGPNTIDLRSLQIKYLPGYQKVIVSCVHSGILFHMHSAFETLATYKKRILLIHGTADSIVPYSEAAKLHKLLPQAQIFPVEGSSHHLTTEAGSKEQVRDKLIEFFVNVRSRP